MMTRNIFIAFVVFIHAVAALPEVASGQIVSRENLPYAFGYGLTGGLTMSGFTGDSVNYNGVTMPYGAFFMALDVTEIFGLSAEVGYLMKGINRQSPYERYRYNFFSGDVAAHVRIAGFLQLGGGYRYGFENSSRKILLDGNSASGIDRVEVPGFGNYGQWTALAMIYFSPSTSVLLRYGIPSKEVPMTHFQVGVRIDLEKRVHEIDYDKIERDNRRAKIQAAMLKDGILLVRLGSMRSSIAAMEERGMMEEAQKLREATHAGNLEVIHAFSKYTFSEVLFFYDYHSKLVRDGETDTIFFNSKFEPVIPDTPFNHTFIAEFGFYSEPDKSYHLKHDYQYIKDHDIHPDSSGAWIKYGHKGLGVGGIIIMDQQFEPLLKPFPVFTPLRSRHVLGSGVGKERAVIKLNEELQKLYYEH